MSSEFAAALELDRRLYVRAAQEVTQLPLGWALRHHGLPQVHMLNNVRLQAPLPPAVTGGDVAQIADAALAGLAHREVVFDDAPAAEGLAGALETMGWVRRRAVFMELRADPAQALCDERAQEIDEAQLHAAQVADLGQGEFGRSATLAQRLAAAQAAVRAATCARGFGVLSSGIPVSNATLFLDPDVDGRRVAMVESVGTLRAHREHGLAKAVVSAAIRAAGEWAADLIVVPADADDWPQLLYAGLGFEPLGGQVTVTRHG